MFVRTITSTVTFARPFALAGCDGVQPPGTYSVETDEEMMQTPSVTAYRRLTTLMRFPAGSDAAGSSHIVAIDVAELEAALARDARPAEAVAAPAPAIEVHGAPVASIAIPPADLPQPRRSRWSSLMRLACLALLFGSVWFAGVLVEI